MPETPPVGPPQSPPTPTATPESVSESLKAEVSALLEAREEKGWALQEKFGPNPWSSSEWKAEVDKFNAETDALIKEFLQKYPQEHQKLLEYFVQERQEELYKGDRISLYENVDLDVVAKNVIARGKLQAVADFIKNVAHLPRSKEDEGIFFGNSVGEALIAAGGRLTRDHLYTFRPVTQEIASAIIETDGRNASLNLLSRWAGYREGEDFSLVENVHEYLKRGMWFEVLYRLEVEEILSLLPKEILRDLINQALKEPRVDGKLLDNSYLEVLITINKKLTPEPIEVLERFTSLTESYRSYRLFTEYVSGELNDEQLVALIEKIKSIGEEVAFRANKDALRECLGDDDMLDALATYLRIEDAEFGSHDSDETRAVIERYLEKAASYVPLPEEYSNRVIAVAKTERKRNETIYTPEFKERWKTLCRAIVEATEYAEGDRKLKELVDRFSLLRSEYIKQKRNDIEKHKDNPVARNNATKELAAMESISPNIRGFEQFFNTLFDTNKHKEFNHLLLTLGLTLAIRTQREAGLLLDEESATADEVSQALNLVTHIAHQETWENMGRFANKQAQKKLRQLFHTKALEEQLVLMQGQMRASKETVEITTLPSRDILTEFSGHTGDACWASKYEVLERDNFSSLTFFLNGQVAGSCLLIDAKTRSGKPLTIIRGLNPLESVINKLDQESFMKGLVGYLDNIATKRGRRLAIVIDDHSGGSGTNRPQLFNYLNGLKNALKRAPKFSNKETDFNEYDITRDTYLISPESFGSRSN